MSGGIIDELREPLAIDLSSTFGFFSSGMGGYVAVDYKNCKNEKATIWFTDEQPQYNVNFWDVVDEWIVLGFENPKEVTTSQLEEWKDFLLKLYNKLINLDFKTQNISFSPELTRIQKFKLKKNNPRIPEILINESPGKDIDIPKI